MRHPYYRVFWITLPLSVLFLAWTFYSRWQDNQSILKRMNERKAADARAFQEVYGGDSLVIRTFYAEHSAINPGQTVKLCYSVLNAKNVRFEPAVENVWPSFSRCVEVSPSKDTVYKFIAEDDKGNTKTASVAIKVLR